MTGDRHEAELRAENKELRIMLAILIARTGADRAEFTLRDLVDVPPAVRLVVVPSGFDGGRTVLLDGMPPLDGIVDAEWTEEPGPRALAVGG